MEDLLMREDVGIIQLDANASEAESIINDNMRAQGNATADAYMGADELSSYLYNLTQDGYKDYHTVLSEDYRLYVLEN